MEGSTVSGLEGNSQKSAVGTGPVGTGNYVVKQGDCMTSIAVEHGFFWKMLWDLPENSEIKNKRKNPNLLLPGDRVFVPNLQLKEKDGSTEQRHRFRSKLPKMALRIVVKLGDDDPAANEPYDIVVDGRCFQGITDDTGTLEQPIPADARKAHLLLKKLGLIWVLKLGHLDPPNTVTGVQARLSNLGFKCGPVDGIVGPMTQAAIEQFQMSQNLTVSGKLDDQTINRMEEIHDAD